MDRGSQGGGERGEDGEPGRRRGSQGEGGKSDSLLILCTIIWFASSCDKYSYDILPFSPLNITLMES